VRDYWVSGYQTDEGEDQRFLDVGIPLLRRTPVVAILTGESCPYEIGDREGTRVRSQEGREISPQKAVRTCTKFASWQAARGVIHRRGKEEEANIS